MNRGAMPAAPNRMTGRGRGDDLTNRRGVLVVAGPKSRKLPARVTDADLSNAAFPWLSGR